MARGSGRDAYVGGAGGARIVLHTEFFPFLLPREGAFSRVVDSLFQERFSGGKPLDLIIVLLEKSLKTKIYPCGGTYICIDVLSEEAVPPALGITRRPWG